MADDNSTGVTGNANATTQAATTFFDLSGWLLFATIEFYINYAVIVIGIVGIAANALVLYALIVHRAQEAKKKGVQLLIINQNLLDLCCCVTVVICLSIRVSNIYLTGAVGYILCRIFINESAALSLLSATVINLMALTIERYLKVVYPFWSKKNLKQWMIHAAIGFSWIGGILSVVPVGLVTSFAVEGTCLAFQLFWEYPPIKVGYSVWSFLSFFLFPLIIFVYCYGHIVVVMRKQMRVMAGHNVEGSAQSASQAQSKRIKWNIIKTMIIISVFFIICCCPLNIYVMVVDDMQKSYELTIGYFATLFLPYVNISLNPFIYATKHEGVRRILSRMITCRKCDDVAAVSGTSGTNTSIGTKKRNTAVAPRQ